MIGKTVSHYRIEKPLGAGGMGVVYEGEDVRLGRRVALKFVPEELAKDRQAIERLKSEARTASGLNHPNICTIYDIGEDEGQPFIVMELLTGHTLRERLESSPLKVRAAVDLGIQIADALDAAHQRSIIHRDIKPANIFLMDAGHVKVLDFGLAKLVSHGRGVEVTGGFTRDRTVEGITLGTVAYMSPEQVTGDDLDGRTDLFSLGVVLYEALTGHQPFTGKTSAVVFAAILNRAPVAPVVLNPDVPLRLQEVINNCLEKDRELRYQNAADLRADLKRVRRDMESGQSGTFRTRTVAVGARDFSASSASDETVAAPVGTPAHGSSPRLPAAEKKSKGLIVGLTAASAIVILGGAYWIATTRSGEPPTADSAQEPAASRSRLSLATASFEAKDYRSALRYAEDTLRSSPDDDDAKRIAEAARRMVTRFDAAIAQSEQRLAVGDVDGANDALSAARAIDPTSAGVRDLAARIAATPRQPSPSPASRSTAPAPKPAPERPRPAQPTAPVSPSASAAPPPATSAPPPAPAAPPASARVLPPTPAASSPPSTRVPASAPAASAPPSAASTPAQTPAPEASGRSAPPRETAPSPPPEPAPAPRPAPPPARAAEPPPPSNPPPPAETDEAAIRRVVSTYARAIETKDLSLYRAVKPNLSADERRRIEEGFRAVTSQKVTVTIESLEQRGQEATVRLRRRDTIQAGGRQQTADSLQTMTLIRSASGWVIRDIGR